MSTRQDYARIRYVIRRPPNAEDDADVLINAQETIRNEIGKSIVPFDLSASNMVMLHNTGIKIEIDRNDLNSYRIDVNVMERDSTQPLKTFQQLYYLANECHAKLQEQNKGRDVKCFVTFEIT